MTKDQTNKLALGTMVFCTVHGAEGWCRVLQIRARDGYIKIGGFGAWCPPHNFSMTDRKGCGYES